MAPAKPNDPGRAPKRAPENAPAGATGAGTGLRASVIIPHLNTPGLLARCLGAVAAQQLDHGGFEVIVVDNGSREPLDAVARAFPDVRFFTERKAGPGPARNLGAENARGRVLAFVDADIRVGRDWLQQGVAAVERDATHPYGGDVRIDFVDPARPTAIEAYEAVFSFRQKMYIEKRGFSGTGNLMVDRDLWRRVGPFAGIDKAEDRDWGLRAGAIGASPRYLADMRVYHPARQSMTELEARLARLVAHDATRHAARGRSRLFWDGRALLVLASAFLQAPKLLLSPRVPTFMGKLRGLRVLFRTRIFRFQEMRRIPGRKQHEAAIKWNRTA